MRYIFLSLNPVCGYSYVGLTRNLPLYDLFEYLYSREQDERLEISEDEKDPRKMILWSRERFKESLDYLKGSLLFGHFNTVEEFWAYGEEYGKYGRKRFAEMPAIRISRENYENLKQQFEGLYKRNHKYLIMREHDDGHVDMIEKDELSAEDIAIMNREHKIYQNYVKRRDEYEKAHPEKRYPFWRSPADNEFESDFALYDPVDEQGVD